MLNLLNKLEFILKMFCVSISINPQTQRTTSRENLTFLTVFHFDWFSCRDPSVKRTLCKKCCSLLIPGVTATTRQRSKSNCHFNNCFCFSYMNQFWKALSTPPSTPPFIFFLGKNKGNRFTVVRCLSCSHTKTLLNDPEHCLWADRPEAQLEQQKQSGEEANLFFIFFNTKSLQCSHIWICLLKETICCFFPNRSSPIRQKKAERSKDWWVTVC